MNLGKHSRVCSPSVSCPVAPGPRGEGWEGHREWPATLLRPDLGCCLPELELPHLQVDKCLFGRLPREADCGCWEVRRGR